MRATRFIRALAAAAATATPTGVQALRANQKRALDSASFAKSFLWARGQCVLTTAAAAPPEPGKSPLFGTSRIPYVLHPCGSSITFAIPRNNTQHLENLKHISMASLLVYAISPKEEENLPLSLPQVNVTGHAQPSPIGAVEVFFERFPAAKPLSDRMAVYTLQPTSGLALREKPEYLSAEALIAAPLDLIAFDRFALANKLNTNSPLSLGILFKEYTQQPCARAYIYHMDSYGFDLVGRDGEIHDSPEWHRVRLDYPEQITTAAAVEEAINVAVENAIYAQEQKAEKSAATN